MFWLSFDYVNRNRTCQLSSSINSALTVIPFLFRFKLLIYEFSTASYANLFASQEIIIPPVLGTNHFRFTYTKQTIEDPQTETIKFAWNPSYLIKFWINKARKLTKQLKENRFLVWENVQPQFWMPSKLSLQMFTNW